MILKGLVKYGLLLFLMLPTATVGFAATNDLLLRPAEKSARAKSSIIMDVAKAGSHLVTVGERGFNLFSDDQGSS